MNFTSQISALTSSRQFEFKKKNACYKELNFTSQTYMFTVQLLKRKKNTCSFIIELTPGLYCFAVLATSWQQTGTVNALQCSSARALHIF